MFMKKRSVMRGRYKTKGKNVDHGSKRRESNGHDVGHNVSSRGHFSLVSDESIGFSGRPNSPVPGETLSCPEADHSSSHGDASIPSAGLKPSRLDTETRYLGVRVKMPVKDMLRNIRLAKGLDPQGIHGQASKGEKKRVNTHRERKNSKKIKTTKSLEELAIIVEVLEEDLKSIGTSFPQPLTPDYSHILQPLSPDYSPAPQPLSPDYSPILQPLSPDYSPPPQPLSAGYSPPLQPLSPGYSPHLHPLSPDYSPHLQPHSPGNSPPLQSLPPGYRPTLKPLSPDYSPPLQPLPPGYSPPLKPLSPDYSPPLQPLSPDYSPPLQPLSPGYSSPLQPLPQGYSPPLQPLSPDCSSPPQPLPSGYSPPLQPLPPGYSPPLQPSSPGYSPPLQPLSPAYSPPLQSCSPGYSSDSGESTWSPEAPGNHPLKGHQQRKLPPDYPQPGFPPHCPRSISLHHLSSLEGYNSEGLDDMMSSPGSYMSHSPSHGETQFPFPPSFVPGGGEQVWDGSHGWDSTAFFWTQLQRQKNFLREVSDTELLAGDENGMTALHRAVCQGHRAQAYAIAQRMAALNSLELRDAEGKTVLHLAAQNNQHLIVEDLIRLGANANEKDWSGKTCVHLSAENGYIRVLEVLESLMKEGVHVDLEATDNLGLNVLQSAALSLKLTELERNVSPDQARIHALRKEQITETLECLLLIGSSLHTLGQGVEEDLFFQGASRKYCRSFQGRTSPASMESDVPVLKQVGPGPPRLSLAEECVHLPNKAFLDLTVNVSEFLQD